MALFGIHQGNRGLPEFGISEAIGGFLGQGRTAQGGSNLFGGAGQASSQPQGQVMGSSTENLIGSSSGPGGAFPTGRPIGPTGPVGGGGGNSGGQNIIPTPSAPDTSQIDAAYNPLLSYLDQAQNQLGADRGGYINDINAQFDTSRQQLQNGYNSTTQTLANQGQQGAKQKQDVISAAQRMYQELMQGNQQRFGGASSAGQAASEIQGRELQRNTSSAQNQYGELVQQLGQKKLEVDNNYQLGLKQIDDQKNAAINEINRSFQDKLSQINSQRAQTESAKAQQRLSTLQQYRDQVYQVQVQNAQMRAQLDQFKASAGSQLQAWQEQLSGANQYGANALSGFGQNVQGNASNFSGVGQQQAVVDPTLTGQISQPSRRPDDPLYR